MDILHFDAHTHAQFPAYDTDRDAVMRRARDAGLGMVNVGSELESSKKAVALAHAYEDGVYACIGRHPIHAVPGAFHDANELSHTSDEESTPFDYAAYRELAKDPRVVAIGECGLDYFRLEENREETEKKQEELFRAQIELAHEVRKPLMIHCRSAFPETIRILEEMKDKLNAGNPGIVHFFTGKKAHAERLLELGFSFTFGGLITYVQDYDKIIRLLPIDRIMSETDAPYVPPVPHRGERNEPVWAIEAERRLAALKEVPEEEMARRIVANAKRVFQLQ